MKQTHHEHTHTHTPVKIFSLLHFFINIIIFRMARQGTSIINVIIFILGMGQGEECHLFIVQGLSLP